MTEPFVETDASASQRKFSRASAYSACIQEAMRFDRLPSSDYPLVMTILHAVLQGHTEERWQEDNQRTIQQLHQQPPERRTNHADEVDRYAQTVSCLKDLQLWPW
ncbi:MAG TPA: hypothetical protein VGM01_13900 [Ktedonobacteraceae bacterium]|jgi:hypothetical protein